MKKIMKKIFVGTLVFLAFASCSKIKFSNPSGGEENLPSLKQGSKLVTVNGNEIRQGYIDFLARVNPRIKGQLDNPATRQKILENLVEQELLYQESVKRGLDRQAEVQEKAALYKRVIISQSLMDEELKKQAKEYYEKNKDTQFTKIALSQILINFKPPQTTPPKTEPGKKPEETEPTAAEKETAHKKALETAARLKGGEDFAKIAGEVSNDKLTQKKGGEMGEISRDDKRMARLGFDAVLPVAFSLKNGDVSDPIETKKGFVIIKVTSDPKMTPFEEAKKIIDFQIQSQVKDTLLADLKKSAKVVYATSVSNPPPPVPMIPPAMNGEQPGVKIPPPVREGQQPQAAPQGTSPQEARPQAPSQEPSPQAAPTPAPSP